MILVGCQKTIMPKGLWIVKTGIMRFQRRRTVLETELEAICVTLWLRSEEVSPFDPMSRRQILLKYIVEPDVFVSYSINLMAFVFCNRLFI